MIKHRKYLPLQVNLTDEDQTRLKNSAKAQNRKKGELAREAVRWYLTHYDRLKEDSMDSLYTQELKKTTNRLAAMLARIHVELGTLYEIQYCFADPQVFEECLHKSKQRIRKRLVKDQEEIAQAITKNIRQDSSVENKTI